MKTAIHLEGKTLNNPTRKTISGILRRTPAEYEMSRYLIKKIEMFNKMLGNAGKINGN